MKEHLTQLCQLLILMVFACALQACGGSETAPKYSITTNTNTISFANEQATASDDSIAVAVSFDGNGVLVGYAPEATPVPWLNFRVVANNSNNATVHVDVVNAEFLPAEQYSTTVRLATGDDNTDNLVYVDIPVSLNVWQLDTDSDQLTFATTYGASTITAQALAITSAGNQWQASADVDWLLLDVNEGTGDATITITPSLADL